MKWIDVKDKLPEIYDYVLVFCDSKGTCEPKPIALARLEDKINWAFLCEYEDGIGMGVYMDLEWQSLKEDITHWMPLPKPPNGLY